MRKKWYTRPAWYLPAVMFILSLTACTLHIPPEGWDVPYSECVVILDAQPDDAEVLLDGKLIGEAYEFATQKSALRLPSKNHELVIKKEGYRERVIHLRDYSTYEIMLQVTLNRDNDYHEYSRRESVEGQETVKETKTEKPEYVAKTEPVKEPPVIDPKNDTEPKTIKPVNLSLEISPPESSIYLNGKFWGISPPSGKIDNFRLKPGTYILAIVKPGYQAIEKKIIAKDKDIKLIIKLSK